MGERSDADIRYFPDVVDRIVAPWRDPALDVPSGRVVVVGGTPQSGRTTVLGQVAADLRRAGFRVVRRAVRDGALQIVDEPRRAEHVTQGATLLAAALQVAGAGAVGNLVSLAAEIATAHRTTAVVDPGQLPSDPYVAVHRVAEVVRQRAEHEPLVLVVDDADKLDTPEVWWDALFGTRLPRLAARLPVLVVLGVERTSTARSHALQVVDTRLLPAGLAEEIRLPALDPARIVAALGPVDDALLGQLRSLVHGRPAWLEEVWREWRGRGAVERRDGRWTAAPDARDRVRVTLHGWVESALRAGAPDGDAYWRAKQIVETAALEGPRFTVEALATVLGDDVEELIDWIDEHLADPDGPSLLAEDGFVARAEGVEPPELRCYHFRSAMVAGVLRREVLDGTSGTELARTYAHALAQVYRWSSVSSIAWTISRLATTAGDAQLAEYIWRRANRLEGLEAAARLAGFLTDHLDVETVSADELAATLERLNDLTGQLVGQWQAAGTLELCRRAERAARALPDTEDAAPGSGRRVALLGEALGNAGQAALRAGETDAAIAFLREAAELSMRTSDAVHTANAYRLLANAELVGSPRSQEGRTQARGHIGTALDHARRSGSRAALALQASCLDVIAMLAADKPAERPQQVESLREAAGILLDPIFLGWSAAFGKIIGNCVMSAANLAWSEERLEVAERLFEAVARCDAWTDDRCTALGDLSVVRRSAGDHRGAVRAACQALRLAQSYGLEDEGAALTRLSYSARSLEVSLTSVLVVLADARLGRSTLYFALGAELRQDFGDTLAGFDDATRRQIERDYRADRGARLLRDAFDVDVAEIDALNERLGDATEDELRGFLLDVQRYCTRDGPGSARPEG